MTQNDFFIEHDKYIRGLIYKTCKSEDMRDDVYSEVVMSLLSSGTVFDLPKPAQIAYIRKAVQYTSFCQIKSLKKSRTYGDLQSDDNDTDPEEYAIPDDTYSPDAEKQDFAMRDKALDLAEQWKTTKHLVTALKERAGIKISNITHTATSQSKGSKISDYTPRLRIINTPIKKRLRYLIKKQKEKKK